MNLEEMQRFREERERIAQSHGPLLSGVSAILFRHDPIGINFEGNTDEYDSEAATILKRIRPGIAVTDVRRIVHEEFVTWFGADIAGPEHRYGGIAADVLASYEAAGSPLV